MRPGRACSTTRRGRPPPRAGGRRAEDAVRTLVDLAFPHASDEVVVRAVAALDPALRDDLVRALRPLPPGHRRRRPGVRADAARDGADGRASRHPGPTTHGVAAPVRRVGGRTRPTEGTRSGTWSDRSVPPPGPVVRAADRGRREGPDLAGGRVPTWHAVGPGERGRACVRVHDGTFGPRLSRPGLVSSSVMTLLLSRWQFGITTVFHFIFVPLTIGLALLLAIMQTAAYRARGDAAKRAKWERHDPLLASAVPDQLRHRRGHRHRPGVPVRHELVDVLALRGQRLRRPVGHRGTARLLPRVDVPRDLDLRQGPRVRPRSTWPRSGWSASGRCCRRTSSWPPTPGCSTRWATRSRATGRS